ncbi:hypothetical protein K2173_012133 [Erythroxylum novogranatense]|uniref:Lipid droplet-associated hydrolase n=1 Tax=Erythroxylum novogranatense TaxID=1862640 RepID=A0AAV8SRV8_9ROSI|nr:hypothetical protein K2173_012133 [Erythroxylum novogranatense]
MSLEKFNCKPRRPVSFRLCNVSGYTTEVMEILSQDPSLHVLFVPGNPGIISFYKDFLEALYEFLGETASVTAIGHISQTEKNWERGKLFLLQEQIDHKVDFVRQQLLKDDLPIVLVGHSIGAYMSMETLKRYPEKVIYCAGLYPYLMFNPLSKTQILYKKVFRLPVLCFLLSFCIASLGLLPKCATRLLVSKSVGKSWSATAIDATCSHLLRYHTFRNMLFLALGEFTELSGPLDWAFMRENKGKFAFLFGVDDHWGSLEMYEEISKQVPEISLSIERQGLIHNFCCTEAGSLWIARQVASFIKNIRQ